MYWIIFNILTSIYELYFIAIRKRVSPQHCKKNFWSEEKTQPIFQEYWTEYACKVDWRYFNPKSYVYKIEFINVISTLLLILFYGTKHIKTILTFQMLNCIIYFLTLEKIPNMDLQKVVYLLVSSIWVFTPLYLILLNANK